MARIGTVNLKTENGVVELPVYEPGDISSDIFGAIRLETANGTGVIPATDPSNAEYIFLRVQTENHGVLAFHSKPSIGPAEILIDDFEDGDIDEYDWDGSGNSSYFSVNSDNNYVYEGDYSLEMQPAGTGGNGIVSEQGLESYPQDGDTIEWYIWFEDLNGGTYGSRPEIRIGETGNGEAIRFRYSNKSNELRFISAGTSTSFDSTNHMYEWLRTELTINLPDVTAVVYDSSGNEIASLEASNQDWDISTESIGYYITSSTAGDSTIYWDQIRKIS